MQRAEPELRARPRGRADPSVGHVRSPKLDRRVDALVRGDLLVFPGGDRDRSLHQSLLAGARFDAGPRQPGGVHTGLFGAVLAGYAHVSAPSSSPVQSGPIVDLSTRWRDVPGSGARDDSVSPLPVIGCCAFSSLISPIAAQRG